MHSGLRLYLGEHRVEPGSFLRSVLENDLVHAAANADEHNQRALFEYARILHSYLPSICWGSSEKVNDWLNPEENGKPCTTF